MAVSFQKKQERKKAIQSEKERHRQRKREKKESKMKNSEVAKEEKEKILILLIISFFISEERSFLLLSVYLSVVAQEGTKANDKRLSRLLVRMHKTSREKKRRKLRNSFI